MPRRKAQGNTRQIYASIREDVYLAAKARAAELRVPLRELIEMVLESALAGEGQSALPGVERSPQPRRSVWDDEYLNMQSQQPLGSPVELTSEEAARVVLGDAEPTDG